MQDTGDEGQERDPTERVLAELEMLKRHLELLRAVKQDEPIGIIMLSEKLEMPQHRVRYSLRMLEAEGVIAPSSKGAVISGDLEAFKSKVKRTLARLGEECQDVEKCLSGI